jgi:hypothetical protein
LFAKCCSDCDLLPFLSIINSAQRDVPIKNVRTVHFCALELRQTC